MDSAIKDNDIPPVMLAKLQQDIFIFSGLKTHAQLLEATQLLLDDKGQIKSFPAFAKDMEKLNDDYNRNYLAAEYQFAITSSQMAANWVGLEESDRYNLQYRTAGDDKVRQEHRELNGITLPKSDPFWVEYYPPNGWNCRCLAIQVLTGKYPVSDSEKVLRLGEKATTQINKDGKNKLELFRFNPGLQSKVFPPKHPYSKVKGGNEVINILQSSDIDNQEERVLKYFDLSKKEIEDHEYYKNAIKENAKISIAEAFCVNKYTGEYFKEINSYLRTGKPKNKIYKDYINITKRGLKKLKSYNGIVYRGTELTEDMFQIYLNAFKSKKPVKEKVFFSTTNDITKRFKGNTFYKIVSKAGKSVKQLSQFSGEEEILFKPGTRFKVISALKNEYGYEIEMEEL